MTSDGTSDGSCLSGKGHERCGRKLYEGEGYVQQLMPRSAADRWLQPNRLRVVTSRGTVQLPDSADAATVSSQAIGRQTGTPPLFLPGKLDPPVLKKILRAPATVVV